MGNKRSSQMLARISFVGLEGAIGAIAMILSGQAIKSPRANSQHTIIAASASTLIISILECFAIDFIYSTFKIDGSLK